MDEVVGSVFLDSSGYDKDATFTGSPTTTRPIVAGGISSQLISPGGSIDYPVGNIMVAGRAERAFSLEAWVKVRSDAGDVAVLARDSSGLFVRNNVISFMLDMDTPVEITYPNMKAGNIYHIVGTYDLHSINLFVNGTRVAEADVLPGDFVDVSTDLRTEPVAGSVVIDTPAVYNYALSYEAVLRHYTYGTNYLSVVNLSSLNDSQSYELCDQNADVYKITEFTSEANWRLGLFENYSGTVDNKLVNVYDSINDQYGAGEWYYQFSFDIDEGAALRGSKIEWDAVGDVAFAVSYDGITYSPISNGEQVVGYEDLTDGYAFTIKVSFGAGTIQSYVSRLAGVFYTSKNVRGSDEDLPIMMLTSASGTPSPDMTVTVLGQNAINTDATSYETDIISAFEGDFLLLLCGSSNEVGVAPDMYAEGLGIEWSEVAIAPYSLETRRLTAFAAEAISDVTGRITISMIDSGDGDVSAGLGWAVLKVGNVDLNNPIRQVEVVEGSGTLGQINLAATIDSGNRAISWWGHRGIGETVHRTGWTELFDNSHDSPAIGYEAQWRADAFESTASASWSTSTDFGGVALEISHAPGTLPAVADNSTLSSINYPPASFNDNAGVLLDKGFKVYPDTLFGGYTAVEMTIMVDAASVDKTVLYVDTDTAQPSITTDASGQWVANNLTALYINGSPVITPFNLEPGIWHHVIATFPESEGVVYVGNNASITAAYPAQVGYFGLYQEEMTSDMVDAIYKAWTGAPATTVAESNSVTISESLFDETGKAFRAYSFDWSITGAG